MIGRLGVAGEKLRRILDTAADLADRQHGLDFRLRDLRVASIRSFGARRLDHPDRLVYFVYFLTIPRHRRLAPW